MTLAAVKNDTAAPDTKGGYKFTKYSDEACRQKGMRAIREERDLCLDRALKDAHPVWALENALAFHKALKMLEDAQN